MNAAQQQDLRRYAAAFRRMLRADLKAVQDNDDLTLSREEVKMHAAVLRATCEADIEALRKVMSQEQ